MTAADLHRRYFQCFNDRDWDQMASLIHPEYTYTGPDGKTNAGGPQLAVGINQTFASGFAPARIEVRECYEAGDVSVLEFTGLGTHTAEIFGVAPTGRPISAAVCDVIELRDGKIYREREYFDMMSLMQQIGAIPETAAAHT